MKLVEIETDCIQNQMTKLLKIFIISQRSYQVNPITLSNTKLIYSSAQPQWGHEPGTTRNLCNFTREVRFGMTIW